MIVFQEAGSFISGLLAALKIALQDKLLYARAVFILDGGPWGMLVFLQIKVNCYIWNSLAISYRFLTPIIPISC
jgi:hypothetical protein